MFPQGEGPTGILKELLSNPAWSGSVWYKRVTLATMKNAHLESPTIDNVIDQWPSSYTLRSIIVSPRLYLPWAECSRLLRLLPVSGSCEIPLIDDFGSRTPHCTLSNFLQTSLQSKWLPLHLPSFLLFSTGVLSALQSEGSPCIPCSFFLISIFPNKPPAHLILS